jgi:hypothetical protein
MGQVFESDSGVTDIKERLRSFINDNCIFRANPEMHYNEQFGPGRLIPRSVTKSTGDTYCFMLRRLFSNTGMTWMAMQLLFDELPEHEFQIAGLETASVPMMSWMQSYYLVRTGKSLNAFGVRKERKAYGLCQYINGICLKDVPVLLVDDLVASRRSTSRAEQIITKECGNVVLPDDLAIVNKNGVDGVKSIFTGSDFDYDFDVKKYWEPVDIS